jgi:hypothetical protein
MNDMFCVFIDTGEFWECAKCGTKITIADQIDEAPLWPCRNPLVQQEDKSQKIVEFMNEHNTKELCSEQVIDYRLSICQQCEHYQDNTCSQCGCLLIRDRNYLNKLANKNEECPVGKWSIDN